MIIVLLFFLQKGQRSFTPSSCGGALWAAGSTMPPGLVDDHTLTHSRHKRQHNTLWILHVISRVLPVPVACALMACSSTIYLTPDARQAARDSVGFAQFRNEMQGRTIAIGCTDGETFDIRDVHLTADSTTFVDDRTGHNTTIPTREVARFIVPDHVAGTIMGFLTGFAGGGALGYAVGTTLRGDQRGLGMVNSVFTGGAMGAVAGGLFGGTMGAPIIYIPVSPDSTHSASVE